MTTTHEHPIPERVAAPFLNKVPAVTATFWLIKILSTTIGETFADFLAVGVGFGTAVTDSIMIAVLAAVLIAQLRTRRHIPWLYWLSVVLVSIVGTQVTDFFTDTLGVSLYVSTAVFAAVLAAVFAVWWQQERTLAITAIDSPKRERFYWGAILVTFALGTAGGDLATEALSLGFRVGVLVFAGLLLTVWLARLVGVDSVPAFWIAYILTRPLGASLGDLLTQDPAYGGIGLGAGVTSVLFLGVIVTIVAREQLNANRHGVRAKGEAPAVAPARDYVWAASGALFVIAAALCLGPMLNPVEASASSPSPTAGQSAGEEPGSNGIEADSTSSLGDLRPFAVIVDDVAAEVAAGNTEAGRIRSKDLEVAWDDAEAALKPASPADWHAMDAAIDQALSTIRATNPATSDILAAVTDLQLVIGTLEHKQ